MPREQSFDRWQRLAIVIHDVESRAAVNVKIDIAWHDYAIAEIGQGNSGGCLEAALRRNFEKASLLNEQQGMLNGIGRSQQSCGSKSQHRNVLRMHERQ
jgi:hypothetical protein